MEGLTFSLKKDADKIELDDFYDVIILGGGPAEHFVDGLKFKKYRGVMECWIVGEEKLQ
jgi:alkyl hydroperoxide reductase subunit AhpF